MVCTIVRTSVSKGKRVVIILIAMQNARENRYPIHVEWKLRNGGCENDDGGGGGGGSGGGGG